ncbi:MAG: protein kinase [Calditrichia bacterium]|nr:protein kinase [Calditrichia bacterium]
MIGKTIGHYTIIEKLGEGGMGVVYKAKDSRLDRFVVLKFLPSMISINSQVKQRFIREAKTASSLDHTNICTIYEIDETEENQIYIVMAYYPGKTLKDIIKKGPLDKDTAVNIVLQIASGLAKANKAGIIHRDIKPGNIIIADDGTVKIIDFGLAKISGDKDITASKSSMGTTTYMSPQQICAEPVDERTDIWSLGVVFYEILTGKPPFRGEYEPSVIYSILSEDPQPVSSVRPGIPSALDHIIEKALVKDPRFRYKNMNQLIHDLEEHPGSRTGEKKEGILHKGKSEYTTIPVWKRPAFIFALLLPLIIITLLLSSVFIDRVSIRHDVIVIDEILLNNIIPEDDPLMGGMITYLMKDAFLQSGDKSVMPYSNFRKLYPENEPELKISGDLTFKDTGFNLRINIYKPQYASILSFLNYNEILEYPIYDPSVLLSEVIQNITRHVLKSEKKTSTFTESWDAFANFYKGEIAWNKLNIPEANLNFKNALNIDPNFVLAKLRLASALSFAGSNVPASQFVQAIKPKLNLLSEIDSLRAEALIARYSNNIAREITILRNVYNKFPLNKEAAYEVAESYYRICDINNAIPYYKKALKLDSDFQLAYNHLAYCYSQMGDHQKALNNFRIYKNLDSTANAYDSMGDGYMAAGLLDSAIWALETAVKIDSTIDYLYWTLCEINLKRGDLNQVFNNAKKYIRHCTGIDSEARGRYLMGLTAFYKGHFDKALFYCQKALKMHDTFDVISRNHDLHWLLAQIYLRLGNMQAFNKELYEMEEIIQKNNINSSNYRRGIYKFYLHLKACRAAKMGNLYEILPIIEEFDGPIRHKVADHGSAFDISFFNASFGEMLMRPNINRHDLAEKQLKKSLKYNQNDALSNFYLSRIYNKKGNSSLADIHRQKFSQIWKDADPDLLRTIGAR